MSDSQLSGAPLLEVRQATKWFPGVLALDRVDLELYRGDVLAVIGENGAGKTTLMNILAGVTSLNSGEVRMEGRPVEIDSVHAAMRLGITLIHQELNLCDNLDVGANIYLGREPRRWGIVNRRPPALSICKPTLNALTVSRPIPLVWIM